MLVVGTLLVALVKLVELMTVVGTVGYEEVFELAPVVGTVVGYDEVFEEEEDLAEVTDVAEVVGTVVGYEWTEVLDSALVVALVKLVELSVELVMVMVG